MCAIGLIEAPILYELASLACDSIFIVMHLMFVFLFSFFFFFFFFFFSKCFLELHRPNHLIFWVFFSSLLKKKIHKRCML